MGHLPAPPSDPQRTHMNILYTHTDFSYIVKYNLQCLYLSEFNVTFIENFWVDGYHFAITHMLLFLKVWILILRARAFTLARWVRDLITFYYASGNFPNLMRRAWFRCFSNFAIRRKSTYCTVKADLAHRHIFGCFFYDIYW